MPRITELRMPKFMRVAYCYVRDKGVVKLYDDEPMPRVLIATVSGSDLDGWQWRGEVEGFKPAWDAPKYYPRWRAALMDAVGEWLRAEWAK